jgi:hypothetical protein
MNKFIIKWRLNGEIQKYKIRWQIQDGVNQKLFHLIEEDNDV